MKYTKTIVCFANSRKTSGRCIAGKELRDGKPGDWVRPVSARLTHEVSEEERRYEDGRDPRLLDILDVPIDAAQPTSRRRENHVIDPDYYWVKKGNLRWNDIRNWLDKPKVLWNVGQGSYAGLNNRVAIGQEEGNSLFLIPVDNLRLLVGRKAPEYPDSKRAVRGEFIYNGANYRMDVTDPVIERSYLNEGDGQYDIGDAVLCVSLGDPYQGYFYKLIAAVLHTEQFK